MLVAYPTAGHGYVEACAPRALALAELTVLCQPFLATAKCLGELGRREVGMLLEESARVFLDESIDMLIRARERVEGMYGRRMAIVRDGVVA